MLSSAPETQVLGAARTAPVGQTFRRRMRTCCEHQPVQARPPAGHSSASKSPGLRRFRGRSDPRVPARPASSEDGKEGVDGSSPSEGFRNRETPGNRGFLLSAAAPQSTYRIPLRTGSSPWATSASSCHRGTRTSRWMQAAIDDRLLARRPGRPAPRQAARSLTIIEAVDAGHGPLPASPVRHRRCIDHAHHASPERTRFDQA